MRIQIKAKEIQYHKYFPKYINKKNKMSIKCFQINLHILQNICINQIADFFVTAIYRTIQYLKFYIYFFLIQVVYFIFYQIIIIHNYNQICFCNFFFITNVYAPQYLQLQLILFSFFRKVMREILCIYCLVDSLLYFTFFQIINHYLYRYVQFYRFFIILSFDQRQSYGGISYCCQEKIFFVWQNLKENLYIKCKCNIYMHMK
eukprot:TRINITY_DN4951_c0_g2_i4.p3 TRINITY_DN4951_c0_g2~~TRINITY_DN4951_c0_g2_i4.p3  ORF type:complete len:203 (-),score=-10.31 TRINITY_DN4951_c0_g2_i4:1147-1755(-)